MRDHAREATAFIEGLSRKDLDGDRVLVLALSQLLQIVGEAANRVSPAFRESCLEVPWQQIVALRNRLIHGYDAINLDVLWEILTGDLPPLISALDLLLER